MRGVKHYMLDIASPHNRYTASDYVRDGREAIQTIIAKGSIPIICGGTGFYIDALLGKITIPTVPPNSALRNTLHSLPLEELQHMLRTKDPHRASTIDMHNPVRIIRALEIIDEIGFVPNEKNTPLYTPYCIGLTLPREILNENIAKRVQARMKLGMLDEARELHKHGLTYERMRELGLEYGFLADVLQGKLSEDDMLPLLTTAITQYAKRQMTWFKRNKNIFWIDPSDEHGIEKAFEHVRTFLVN